MYNNALRTNSLKILMCLFNFSYKNKDLDEYNSLLLRKNKVFKGNQVFPISCHFVWILYNSTVGCFELKGKI